MNPPSGRARRPPERQRARDHGARSSCPMIVQMRRHRAARRRSAAAKNQFPAPCPAASTPGRWRMAVGKDEHERREREEHDDVVCCSSAARAIEPTWRLARQACIAPSSISSSVGIHRNVSASAQPLPADARRPLPGIQRDDPPAPAVPTGIEVGSDRSAHTEVRRAVARVAMNAADQRRSTRAPRRRARPRGPRSGPSRRASTHLPGDHLHRRRGPGLTVPVRIRVSARRGSLAPMPFIEGAGVALHYAERGDGPALLDRSRDGVRRRDVGAGARVLAAAGVRAIAYDRRGYGASGAPQPYGATTIQEQAQDAGFVLEALGAAPALLVGDGFGALVVLELLVRAPGTRARRRARRPVAARLRPAATEALAAERGLLEDGLRDGRAGRCDPRVARRRGRRRSGARRAGGRGAAGLLRRLCGPVELVAVAARAARDVRTGDRRHGGAAQPGHVAGGGRCAVAAAAARGARA